MPTNFDKGLDFIKPAIGKAPYWYWPPHSNNIPDGAGAFARNTRILRGAVDNMKQKGIFCQGVINVFRRVNGKVVPHINNDRRWDGGTWANQNFFKEVLRPFNRYRVIPRGAIIGRYFRWASDGSVRDQGHVGVLVRAQNLEEQQDGMLLHSHPAVGGLAYTRLGASHAGWYYDYWIHPEDWINHNKGQF